MNDKIRVHLAYNVLEMKESMDKAMNDAGGAAFTVQDLQKMNALELIAHLAPNGVRFTWNRSVP